MNSHDNRWRGDKISQLFKGTEKLPSSLCLPNALSSQETIKAPEEDVEFQGAVPSIQAEEGLCRLSELEALSQSPINKVRGLREAA